MMNKNIVDLDMSLNCLNIFFRRNNDGEKKDSYY